MKFITICLIDTSFKYLVELCNLFYSYSLWCSWISTCTSCSTGVMVRALSKSGRLHAATHYIQFDDAGYGARFLESSWKEFSEMRCFLLASCDVAKMFKPVNPHHDRCTSTTYRTNTTGLLVFLSFFFF